MFKNRWASLICSMLLFCSSAALGQDKRANQTSSPASTSKCPTIVINCPADPIDFGLPPTKITARITGADLKTSLTYNWSVTNGTIVGGQNTPTITIDTSSNPFQCLTATLEVEGLPGECPKIASCTQRILGIADPRQFDEYGGISFREEKLRLDNIAYQLKQEPDMFLRIVGYDGRHARKGTARKRVQRAIDYIIKVHGIESVRIRTEPLFNYSPEKETIKIWFEPNWELLAGPCN